MGEFYPPVLPQYPPNCVMTISYKFYGGEREKSSEYCPLEPILKLPVRFGNLLSAGRLYKATENFRTILVIAWPGAALLTECPIAGQPVAEVIALTGLDTADYAINHCRHWDEADENCERDTAQADDHD